MSLLHERLPQCERLLQGTLRVVRVSVFSTDWDDFAARCGASPYCARNYLRIYGLLYGLHLFEFVQHQDGVQTKIGQCAVVGGRRARRFCDGVQLLPGFDHYWNNAVAAVLQMVGPGRYHYGSGWRLETPREKELDGLTGVSIDHIQRVVVEAVDFSRWASWEEYSRSISNNARRNAKRAINMHSDVTLVFRRGLWTMVSVPCLTWLRRLMLRRKGGGIQYASRTERAGSTTSMATMYGFRLRSRREANYGRILGHRIRPKHLFHTRCLPGPQQWHRLAYVSYTIAGRIRTQSTW